MKFYKGSIFSVLNSDHLLQIKQELAYEFIFIVRSTDLGFTRQV
jgi:hypothetical protein